MKVGDLVRIIHHLPWHQTKGIILKMSISTAFHEKNAQCLWEDGDISWCIIRRLEVINEMVL